jgi:hypothetical protein
MFGRKKDDKYQRLIDFIISMEKSDDSISDKVERMIPVRNREGMRSGKIMVDDKGAAHLRSKKFDNWLGKSCKHRCTLCADCLEDFRKIIAE